MDQIKEMYREFIIEEKISYEDKLRTIFSHINIDKGGYPTPIQKDICDISELLSNYPGTITNMVEPEGRTDVYALPVFKYPLPRLKMLVDHLLKSKRLSPDIVELVEDLDRYGSELSSYYEGAYQNQLQQVQDLNQMSGHNFRKPRRERSFQSNPNISIDNTSAPGSSIGVEIYHLVTATFGGVGEVLNMHYYVKATAEQAARLNRSYWLTEDEAIERLESIRHRIQSGPSQSRGIPTFRGPNFKDSVSASGRSLTIDLQDATELSVTEAVSSKGSMLIDIYEEHFGEDMIIIQTTDKTYYCRTINMTGVNNSQNLITFNDIVSVIPAGVSCTFGKRTVYGLDNNPEELTPKQVFRKMLELS